MAPEASLIMVTLTAQSRLYLGRSQDMWDTNEEICGQNGIHDVPFWHSPTCVALVQLGGNPYPVCSIVWSINTTISPRQTGAACAVRSTNQILALSKTHSGACACTTRTLHERGGLQKRQGCVVYTPPPPTITPPGHQEFVPPLNTVSPTLTSQRSSPSK